METVIVLKIVGGDFDSGFSVGLQVWDKRGGFPSADRSGYLPPHPHLEGYYFNWQTIFRKLNSPNRGDNFGFDEDLPDRYSSDDDREACRKFAKLLEQNMRTWLLETVDVGWQQIREKVIEELAENKDSVRIVIQSDPQLWKMPWLEWDILSKDNDWRDIGIGFSPVAYQKIKKSQPQRKQGDRVRILAVFGNNENIDLTPDKQAIAQLPDVELEPLEQPSAAEVIQKLRDKRGWDIFLFAGHSQTKGDEGIIYINDRESLEIGQFKDALKEAIRQGLQLAIFNSCDGLGLAEKLASLHLPIAIVMKEPVPDQVAQRFLKEFLTEYASGAYLYTAVRRSQKCLEEFADFPGCTGLPIVCQNPAEVPPTWEELRGRKTGNIRIPESIDISDSGNIFRDHEKQARDKLSRSSVGRPPIIWRKLRYSLVLSFAIGLFIISAQWQGKLQTWELHAFDHLMRQLPIEQADDRLLIVGADAEDLERYGFPLPNAIIAQLIDKLQQDHPSVIGLNILRKNPEKLIDSPEGDQAFTNILKMTHNLITICQLGNGLEDSDPPVDSASTEWVGFSDFSPDNFPLQIPTIRRLLLTRDDNKIVTPSHCNSKYSFVFLLAYYYLSQRGIPVEPVEENWKFGSSLAKPINLGTVGYHNLDASGNQLLIRYRHTQNPEKIAQQVTVRDVLTDSASFNPVWVKDRIVIIGVTSPVEAGKENTPYGSLHRLHIHAHAVSQILSAVDGDRPFLWWWPQWGNTLWIFLWSFLGALIVLILKEAFYQWLGIIGAMGVLYNICRFTLTQGGWIPLIPAGLALGFSTLSLLLYYKVVQLFVNPSKN